MRGAWPTVHFCCLTLDSFVALLFRVATKSILRQKCHKARQSSQQSPITVAKIADRVQMPSALTRRDRPATGRHSDYRAATTTVPRCSTVVAHSTSTIVETAATGRWEHSPTLPAPSLPAFAPFEFGRTPVEPRERQCPPVPRAGLPYRQPTESSNSRS
jgi:hypothetical protein